MQQLLGAPGYVGGVIDPRGGNLHPLNYALGLADAAERAGARLYCDSRVTGPGPDGDLVTVITGQGRVGHDGAKHRTAKDLREFF